MNYRDFGHLLLGVCMNNLLFISETGEKSEERRSRVGRGMGGHSPLPSHSLSLSVLFLIPTGEPNIYVGV
jgi:hypothetical protein